MNTHSLLPLLSFPLLPSPSHLFTTTPLPPLILPLPFRLSLLLHSVLPIVVALEVIRNETESATLAFRIDEAAPLVLLRNLQWFYVADLGSDPYVGQEITNLTTRTTGSALIFSDFTNMRYINLTIVQRGSTVSGETDQGRYFLVATNPAGVSFAYIDLLTQVSRDIQMIGEVSVFTFRVLKYKNNDLAAFTHNLDSN